MSDRDELGLDDEFNLTDQNDIDRVAEKNLKLDMARNLLRSRKEAYTRVFVAGNATPGDCKIVLGDLRRFCRHRKSTFHPNVQMAARLDGRREVALRIDEYTELSVDELVAMKFVQEM